MAAAAAARWSYSNHQQWVLGLNLPAVGRGGDAVKNCLNAAGLQLFGNCVTNVDKLGSSLIAQLYVALTGHHQHGKVDAVTVVAILGGVRRQTARGWYKALEERGWGCAFTAGVEAVGSPREAVGSSQEAVGLSSEIVETALPEVAEVEAAAIVDADSDEEDLGLEMDCVARGRRPCLDVWREHPNYSIGIRLAELSTMWLVHGWQIKSFPMFTNWLKQQAPGIIGNLNHSTRFLQSLQGSLIQACHTCMAASLHAIIPATGMPSLLSRIIDVVSINSASLLPVIYIHTSSEGALTWSLLGCPCSEQIPSAVGEQSTASGSTRWFGLHSGEHLVRKVHHVEESFHLHRADRGYRLVVSMADQAIQGKGSVRFTEKECDIDQLPYSPLKEGVCKFHVADGVGTNVDKIVRGDTCF